MHLIHTDSSSQLMTPDSFRSPYPISTTPVNQCCTRLNWDGMEWHCKGWLRYSHYPNQVIEVSMLVDARYTGRDRPVETVAWLVPRMDVMARYINMICPLLFLSQNVDIYSQPVDILNAIMVGPYIFNSFHCQYITCLHLSLFSISNP